MCVNASVFLALCAKHVCHSCFFLELNRLYQKIAGHHLEAVADDILMTHVHAFQYVWAQWASTCFFAQDAIIKIPSSSSPQFWSPSPSSTLLTLCFCIVGGAHRAYRLWVERWFDMYLLAKVNQYVSLIQKLFGGLLYRPHTEAYVHALHFFNISPYIWKRLCWHFSTFVLACLERVQFVTYVTSFVFAFACPYSLDICGFTYMVQARQMCFYCTVFFRNTCIKLFFAKMWSYFWSLH